MTALIELSVFAVFLFSLDLGLRVDFTARPIAKAVAVPAMMPDAIFIFLFVIFVIGIQLLVWVMIVSVVFVFETKTILHSMHFDLQEYGKEKSRISFMIYGVIFLKF